MRRIIQAALTCVALAACSNDIHLPDRFDAGRAPDASGDGDGDGDGDAPHDGGPSEDEDAAACVTWEACMDACRNAPESGWGAFNLLASGCMCDACGDACGDCQSTEAGHDDCDDCHLDSVRNACPSDATYEMCAGDPGCTKYVSCILECPPEGSRCD